MKNGENALHLRLNLSNKCMLSTTKSVMISFLNPTSSLIALTKNHLRNYFLSSNRVWQLFFPWLMHHWLRHMLTQIVTKSKIFDLPGSLLVTLRGSLFKNFKMRKKRFIHHDSASSTTTGIQRSITTLKRIINRKKFHEFSGNKRGLSKD